jgi:ribosomal protein S13
MYGESVLVICLDLREIKGIGDKLASRIINHFGSQEEFLRAANNYEVYRLASMEGISQRRAVEIINTVLGNPTEEFLKTERSVQIYEEIIQYIIQYASTDYARNRVLLLSPGKDPHDIEKNLEMVMEAKERVSQLPIDDLKNLLKNVDFTKTSKPKNDTSKAILVESREDYTSLMDRGLNQHTQILSINEVGSLDEFELVVYVYREGVLELEETSNLTMVNGDVEDFEIVPEIVLSYYNDNHVLLENILNIIRILDTICFGRCSR